MSEGDVTQLLETGRRLISSAPVDPAVHPPGSCELVPKPLSLRFTWQSDGEYPIYVPRSPFDFHTNMLLCMLEERRRGEEEGSSD